MAQAGWSDRNHERAPVDTQRPQVPAELGADHLVPAGEHDLHESPGSATRRDGPAAGASTRRPAGGRRAAPRALIATSQALAPGAIRATSIPSGRGAAVVRIDWPAGSSATRARLRAGSSSENTSSSSRVGTSGGPGPDQLVDAEAQRQGQAALLALRGVRPGLPPVDRQQQVVAVRAHGVDAPPQVVRAGWRARASSRSPSQLRT